MLGLTDKQKELFQEDKYTLVDKIIHLENELNLCYEANITAQEEIDGKIKPKKLNKKQNIELTKIIRNKMGNDAMNHQLQDKIDKIEALLDRVWDGSISDTDFKLDITTLMCSEGGENGVL